MTNKISFNAFAQDAGTGTWEVEYRLTPQAAQNEGVSPEQGESFSDASEARRAYWQRLRQHGIVPGSVKLLNPWGEKVA